MESLEETKTKVKLLQNVGKSRRAELPVDFLQEKAAADCELRQQEFIRAKHQEQESQQQMMKAMILQQQQFNK